MRAALIAALLLAGPAAAQIDNPPANMVTSSQLAAVQATIPTAGAGSPTAIVDTNTGAAGAAGVYAPFNHTHPSKARKGIISTAIDGTATATFSQAFPAGTVPICQAIAVPPAGSLDVINAQLDGPPTNTQVAIRVTRTQRTAVATLGLTLLSVPVSIGVSTVHYLCLEP